MRLNKRRELKRRPTKIKGYDDFYFYDCKFDIIINGVIYSNEYSPKTVEHVVQDMWHTMYDVNWDRLQDFINNVVVGYIQRRIALELNFDRYRAYQKIYSPDYSIREEVGLPPILEEYINSVAEMCYAILHEGYPLCIDLESCGLFSEDEKNSKVVIKVVR